MKPTHIQVEGAVPVRHRGTARVLSPAGGSAGSPQARLHFPGSVGNAGFTEGKGRKKNCFVLFFLLETLGDDKVPKMLRRALTQLSLSSMKCAGLCIGRPALLTSADGRQEVRPFLDPLKCFCRAVSACLLYSMEPAWIVH